MTSATIFQHDGFSVVSYGNGLAYAIHDADGREAFIQGDDALCWRDMYDALDAIEDAKRAVALKMTLVRDAFDYA